MDKKTLKNITDLKFSTGPYPNQLVRATGQVEFSCSSTIFFHYIFFRFLQRRVQVQRCTQRILMSDLFLDKQRPFYLLDFIYLVC